MVLSLYELSKCDFTVSQIAALYQQRTYKTLTQKSRPINGFLLIESGEGDYYYGNNEVIHIAPGTIIYLPYGSNHKLTVLTDEIDFYRIDFRFCIDGEISLFSEHPFLITPNAGSEIFDFTKKLCSVSLTENRIEKTYLLCKILDLILKEQSKPRRTLPAIEYIRKNYKEELDVRSLAEMCYLSTAQFYRIFLSENGKTPLKYRDELLIKNACLLLHEEQSSVAETALQLGFTDTSYFSRFFKKNMGIAPSEY